MMAGDQMVIGGRYELEDLLGRGGMAEVRRAVDTRLGRPVAIKQLRADLATDPTFQARFRREAQSAAGLNHPNIVAVYDTGEETDPRTGTSIPYIVMELVEGPTLRDVLRDGRKILPERALELTQGVLDALSYSHRAGIIHRDIKPANVMLTQSGTVKVMDFGIARAVADTSATMTQTAAVIGTAQYLSPEQARGETVDARSDIYSAGCLMYELLVGRPPFVGDSPVSVAYQHVRETPVPPSQLDPVITPDIDTVTLKALAKDPADRYQSAREMKADITRVLAGQQATAVVPRVGEDATAATPTQVVPPATMVAPVAAAGPPLDLDEEEERKPRVGLAIAITAAIILVLGLGAFALYSILTPEQPTVQTVAVPNVLNFPQKLAVEQLEGQELKVSIKKENGKDDETKGTVTAQNPVPDTAVEPGSTVTITVNVGPETGKIPKNLVGKDKDDVQEALEDAGFTNVDLKEAEEEDPDTEPDEVISVSPKEGATAAKSGKVTVTYATGKSPVPDFTGLSEQRARDDARAAGFDSVEVVEEETNEQPVGTVIRQNPKPGDVAERTFKIRLVVAQAVPEPTPTPTPPSTPPPSPSPTPSATPS
ncbi:MAG TPA: Stk1 family PASTA domain-containing Ser/Thr kinase [Propionibacteriaceae bacterium]|jgi:serine/threonine-protein kinase|nr:Stk1 family PASTA domain-containing Ser/Thr kinase [Propionibacteriaceae bacterium]